MNINKAIKKLCKLKILTPEFWHPKSVNCVWNIYVSDRSTGKTSSFLLIGLMLYKSESIITHYIRSTSPMISAGKIANMFGSIVSLGYVSEIFENRWNNVIYQRSTHKFYLCLCDEDGHIIEQDTTAFCVAMSIDNAETYKSSYQCDKGDFIVFDEFINSYYRRGEFPQFCDLCSTIIRKRMTAQIFLLANTIERNSEYFDELECRDFIDHAEQGDVYEYDLSGTSVHVEVLGVRIDDKRKKFNARYFSFKNPRLASITGTGWAVKNYQHIDRPIKSYLARNLFIFVQNKYIQLDVVRVDDSDKICVYAHLSKEPEKEDAYIYSIDRDCYSNNTVYARGTGNPLDKWFWNLEKNNLIFFSNNSVGSLFEHYKTITKYL